MNGFSKYAATLYFAAVLAGSCTVAVSATSLDEAFPPLTRFEFPLETPQTKIAPVHAVQLGTLTVVFEKTTLADVQKAASAGTIRHRGDAGESEDALCFTARQDGRRMRLWLTSGEMGGGELVMGFAARDVAVGSAACPPLPGSLLPISFGPEAPWLGWSAQKVTARLGAPSLTKDGWLLYFHEQTAADGGDVSNVLEVQIENGKVTEISEDQVTTY